MIRRLRCLVHGHVWQADSSFAMQMTRLECSRCGAHLRTGIRRVDRYKDPGSGGFSQNRMYGGDGGAL